MKISVAFYEDKNSESYKKNIYNHINKYFQNNLDIYDYTYIQWNDFKLVKADYAIMWNIAGYKPFTIYRQKIKDFQKENNNKLIVMEEGFLKRGTYYTLSYDSIINFGNYPSYPNNNDRLNKLNLESNFVINYDNNPDKHILFCLQIFRDTQVNFLNYAQWAKDYILLIRKYTKRKIIIRKHPSDKTKLFSHYNDWLKEKKFKNYEMSKNSLDDDFKNAYCVVALNSTVLVDAVLKSIPIIAGHYSSIVYEIAEKKIKNINNLQKFSKENIINCLSKIAYKQWSLEEIKNGTAFPYYIKN